MPKRAKPMKSLLTKLCLGLLLVFSVTTLHAARSNILFLNADDLGWTDAGFMGSAYYDTPNLDRIAGSGMVFTQAYSGAANCAPSRASLYSGQVMPRHGVFTVGDPARGKAAYRKLIPTPNKESLDPSIPTFPALLQQAGYRTIHVGKWHIGKDPTQAGFDVNIGGCEWGHPHRGYFSPYRIPGFEDGPKGEYLTERLAKDAVREIQTLDPSKPFFISYHFYSPHTPIQAKADKIAEFEAKPPSPTHSHATYAAMISHLDDAVGQLLDSLEKRGLLENTVVVFTSDNGGLHNFSSQAPLRGEKGTYYEGGIRVPLAISWPGSVTAGSRSEIPVSNLDFFPTFLEIARASAPEGHTLDGDSLVPMLTGKAPLAADRELAWHFPIYLQASNGRSDCGSRDVLFRTRPGSIIRVGPWKLHEYFEDGGLELYHLESDPGERRNVAELQPEKTAELHQRLKAWRERVKAPVPAEANPEYDSAAEAAAQRAWLSGSQTDR